MLQLRSYLEDHWVSGEGPGTTLYDPASGRPLATASTQGLDLAAALRHARSVGGPSLRQLNFRARGELLAGIAGAIHGVRNDLFELSRQNLGATRSDAKFDVDGATATLTAYATLGEELGDRYDLRDGPGMQIGRSPRFHGLHLKVPRRGVAVQVNAFNFPVWGLAEKLACAFLAGMPVLSKPATGTAFPASRAAEAMVASGLLPPGTWSFLCGPAGDLLLHLESQDVVAFTGSAETAAQIRCLPNIIKHSVRVNVEADSLNAVVVAPDVEPGSETWQLFLRELVRELVQKSGQKCTATRRVFVPAVHLEAALEALREELVPLKAGPPGDAGASLGPLAMPTQLLEVRRGMERLAAVAELVVGRLPDPTPGGGAFVEPAIFVCRDPAGFPLVHELEVFGPVATLMPYSGDAEEAAALVALGDGGLVATLYSDDLDFTRRAFFELAPHHGRILLGSARIAEHSTGPGMALPLLVHGGPGRAGGGLELGGLRGLDLYLQTCAVQGARPALERLFGP